MRRPVAVRARFVLCLAILVKITARNCSSSGKITAAAREGAAEPNVAGVSFVTLLVDGFVGELNGKQQSGLDLEKVRR